MRDGKIIIITILIKLTSYLYPGIPWTMKPVLHFPIYYMYFLAPSNCNGVHLDCDLNDKFKQ